MRGPGWEIIQPVSEHKRLSEVFSDATFARNHFECTREVHERRGEESYFAWYFSSLPARELVRIANLYAVSISLALFYCGHGII